MENIRHVTVQDMLLARDARAARQQAFLSRFSSPLISFTMNIAGSIKYNALILRGFQEGVSRISRQLERLRAPVLGFEQNLSFTGCEALWAVELDARELKAQMCLLEEEDELGRLFDIDIIAADGSHLSRQSERPCLICGGPVRACARSRTHSAEELFQKSQQIIRLAFQNQLIRTAGELAQKALLCEAMTTPKPGLVDRENSGAHQDMNLFSFAYSVCALRSYLEECVSLGLQAAGPERLRHAGRQAEERMIASAGANTHKGAIFSFGILCYAIGSCGEGASLEKVLEKAAQTGACFLSHFSRITRPETGGEQQYLQYGLTGARGEAASGFRTVQTVSLPAFRRALASGKPLEQAGLEALLHLIAHVQDSNIIRRAGPDVQKQVSETAKRLLEQGYSEEDLRELDRQFTRQHISPGGCADLLAVTYFLHFWQSQLQQTEGF